MGGFFGITSHRDCIDDVFFGVDYHSHLGTKRAGMAALDSEKGFQREIHNIENSPFRTKFDDVPYREYTAIVAKLREAGIQSSVYIGSKKFGKQIDYAVKGNYSHVVIMGTSELEAGEVKVKDLDKREETTVKAEALADYFAKL